MAAQLFRANKILVVQVQSITIQTVAWCSQDAVVAQAQSSWKRLHDVISIVEELGALLSQKIKFSSFSVLMKCYS